MFNSKQFGSALMVVLLIVISMIALIALMTIANKSLMKRSSAINQRQQMLLSARSANNLVLKVLQKNMHNQRLTSLDQPWALSDSLFQLEDTQLSVSVTDMRSCYNINVLYAAREDKDAKWPEKVEILVRLMVLLDIEEAQARILTAKIWDYIDADQVPHRGGAEDVIYRNKSYSILTAGQMILDISELRFVDGMTADNYRKLKQHLCALPNSMLKINVNTLSEKQKLLLLSILDNRVEKETINYWLDARPLGGWINVDKSLRASELALTDDEVKKILPFFSVKSDYFRFDGKLQNEAMSYRWFALIFWQDPNIAIVLQMEAQ